jgi:predicted nucleotidyltransferase
MYKMDTGLHNHLKRMSSDLFIKFQSQERAKINRSIEVLIDRLEEYYGKEIEEIIVFGSYSRDTILPRKYDPNSDIDLLIHFNTDKFEKLQPDSYRNSLRRFASRHYERSVITKDHPSVVLELNHIKFDLVPAVLNRSFWWGNNYRIPKRNGGWQDTDPTEFNEKLTRVNKRNKSIVKPVIRLIKYWNAMHSYPYYSFELETALSKLDYWSGNLLSDFFYAAKNLPADGLPGWAIAKRDKLKESVRTIKDLMEDNNQQKARQLLDWLLPPF